MVAIKDKVPVTVLTGHLGAGKTTLLNRILTGAHGKKFAVIVNEFGEIGVDGALVVGSDEEIYEMNNGCICCTIRGDLVRVISGLLRRSGSFDAILIETTGLADPAPVAQTFFADPDIASKARIDGIVTVVDAKHLPLRLAEKESKEAEEQIAFADVVLLNKTDLVDEAALVSLEATIHAINRYAKIVRTERSEVPLDAILNIGSFDLQRILERDPAFLEVEEEDDSHHHHHDHEECGCHEHHHAHHHHHGEGCECEACKSGHVHHDPLIKSISLVAEKPLDPNKFDAWSGELAGTRGLDLLRYKGILNFKGSDQRFVFQGVHQMMEGRPFGVWPDGDKRLSRFVIIGRKLDEEVLKQGFLACQVEE